MPDLPLDPDAFTFRPARGLAGVPTGGTGPFPDEEAARAQVEADAARLARAADLLRAHAQHGLLLVLQGMDAAGKDEAIEHVMVHVNPQACRVRSFSEMTEAERRQGFLQRAMESLPARGEIVIFNRSYYESVVAERVHPEKVDAQNLPARVRVGGVFERRYAHIRAFEAYLAENGIEVVKCFLHIGREAQRQRLLERLGREDQRWDFSMKDVEERALWAQYQEAYARALEETSTPVAPWYVVPADHRWFARAAVAAVVLGRLASLHAGYPTPDADEAERLARARDRLEADA